MPEIYVITEGEYSDYHICGVFENKELAEEVAKATGGQVEEFMLNPLSSRPSKDYSLWSVYMEYNGDSHVDKTNIVYAARVGDIHIDMLTLKLHVTCWAKDKQHAIKIANEKRVQLIANGEWEEVKKEKKLREEKRKALQEKDRIEMEIICNTRWVYEYRTDGFNIQRRITATIIEGTLTLKQSKMWLNYYRVNSKQKVNQLVDLLNQKEQKRMAPYLEEV